MDISVTEFKHRCLAIIRNAEKTGKPVTITRRGKVIARLQPAKMPEEAAHLRPWEHLRAMGGSLRGEPGESVLRNEDFESTR